MGSLELALHVLDQGGFIDIETSQIHSPLQFFLWPQDLLWAKPYLLSKSLMRTRGCPHYVSLSDVPSHFCSQLI